MDAFGDNFVNEPDVEHQRH